MPQMCSELRQQQQVFDCSDLRNVSTKCRAALAWLSFTRNASFSHASTWCSSNLNGLIGFGGTDVTAFAIIGMTDLECSRKSKNAAEAVATNLTNMASPSPPKTYVSALVSCTSIDSEERSWMSIVKSLLLKSTLTDHQKHKNAGEGNCFFKDISY